MKQLSFILAIIIAFYSCGQPNENRMASTADPSRRLSKINQTPTHSETDSLFKLEVFPSLPDTIDGCGEYFTYDTCSSNDHYIFLSNLQDFAIIKINGENVFLNKDSSESKDLSDKEYISVYKNRKYKAILRVKQIKAYDEVAFYQGSLEVISEGFKRTFKVHGQSGC